MAQHIINTRFGLRGMLKQDHLRAVETSIKESDLTPDLEPTIRGRLQSLAAEIVKQPSLIFADSTTLAEKQADWSNLIKKKVLEAGDIQAIDARSRPGHLIIDNRMPHFWSVANWKGLSVTDLAKEQSIVEKALWNNLKMHTTPYASEIRRTLVMVGGLSNVTKYRAPLAKGIVQWANAKTVLDPCIGWGGRMLGALAASSDVQYVGAEPCLQTFEGLKGILADLPPASAKRATVTNEIGEALLDRLLAADAKFDMVLTSPPYFNLEVYSKEETQSIVAYPTWMTWLTEWLEPLIARCLYLLKDDGISCWSVKNIRTDREYNLADEVQAIHKLHGWTLVKTVKMTGSARPGGGRIKDGEETRQSEEETFCFRKTE